MSAINSTDLVSLVVAIRMARRVLVLARVLCAV